MVDAVKLAAIESEGRRLLEAARQDPGRTVPFYPQWSLTDLAAHTGSVHALAARVVRDLATERVTRPILPPGRDALDWYDQNLTELIAVLRHADPNAPCWGFRNISCVDHWLHRMLVETGVHRWDAEQAFGDQGDLTKLVAESGLDEFERMWLPLAGDVQTIRVHATDLSREWIYGEGTPTDSVEGTASDIYLALMTRPSPVTLPEDWAAACASLPPPPAV